MIKIILSKKTHSSKCPESFLKKTLSQKSSKPIPYNNNNNNNWQSRQLKKPRSFFQLNLLRLSAAVVNGSPPSPTLPPPLPERVPPTLPAMRASGGRLEEEIAEVFRSRKDNVASYVNQPGMRVCATKQVREAYDSRGSLYSSPDDDDDHDGHDDNGDDEMRPRWSPGGLYTRGTSNEATDTEGLVRLGLPPNCIVPTRSPGKNEQRKKSCQGSRCTNKQHQEEMHSVDSSLRGNFKGKLVIGTRCNAR